MTNVEPVRTSQSVRLVGRYALSAEIASGGMATVHFGRLLGPVGFSRTVAIKRLHPHFARDPEFVTMFLEEARLAARIRHPNVVQTLDVVATKGELFLVMDYVQGESLARLQRAVVAANQLIAPSMTRAIVSGVLHGLHEAHEAKDERGQPLGIVHRDVSPQNIMVGVDGVARVLDFGIAKAVGHTQITRDGHVKGKVAYMLRKTKPPRSRAS
jgi:serine/threonine protein kinase